MKEKMKNKVGTLALRRRLAWPILRVLPAHNNLQ